MHIFTRKTVAREVRASPQGEATTRVGTESSWLVLTLVGLMAVEAVRDGGFWKPDAVVVASVSVVFIVVQLVQRRHDRWSWMVVASFVALALWWYVRAATVGPVSSFLPLGASILGFGAAFVTVRNLTRLQKELAGLFVGVVGAAGALVGFAGLTWRWYPMAMPAQHLWRLSTTLTYADAAGVFLAMGLLMALAGGPRPWVARVAVCLCAGGLIATQSRGAFLAFVCACALVPWRQYLVFLVPLIAGTVLGVVAVATSPLQGADPWLGIAVVALVAISMVWMPSTVSMTFARRQIVVVVVMLAAMIVTGLLLHSEIGLRALAPSNNDRVVEWSAAIHQFESAPILGLGPDQLLHFHAVDGTVAHFAHNEYLQIAADGGLVGVALLALAFTALLRVVRRVDTLSSCAVGALVCLAVAGAFDFDWHLTFLGLLGGWAAGLAGLAATDIPVEQKVL